jgi:excisionase family DNA binding protein
MALQSEPRPKVANDIEKRIWITPREAIRISGIGRTKLYELIDNKTIKSIKLGGKRLISYDSIETLGQ